jgi:hypothetical protein
VVTATTGDDGDDGTDDDACDRMNAPTDAAIVFALAAAAAAVVVVVVVAAVVVEPADVASEVVPGVAAASLSVATHT